MKLNQKGFSAIEGLLIIIALTLIVGVGFYVFNAKDKKSQSTSSQQSNSQPETKVTEQKPEYVEFKELGFKIKKTDKMKDWTFITDPQVPNTRYVQSAAHVKLIDECRKGEEGQNHTDSGPSDKSFAGFTKVDGKYSEEAHPLERSVKQFDTFFISLGFPNGASCTNTNYTGELYKTPPGAGQELESALKNAEKL